MRAKAVVRVVMTVLCCAAVARDARATSFNVGDFQTFIQDDFGDASTPAGMLLDSRFTDLYGAAGYVEVGISGASGFSMLFTSASATYTYLSASGFPAPLNADLVDPTTSSSGLLGGEVLGLKFNVDLSDASYTGSLGLRFGDLVIHSYADLPQANGLTVRQLLAEAENLLGGGVTIYDLLATTTLLKNLNASFAVSSDGSFFPDFFANKHLEIATSGTQPVPEPATVSLLGLGVAAMAVRRRIVRSAKR